jgi:hypothetical protein
MSNSIGQDRFSAGGDLLGTLPLRAVVYCFGTPLFRGVLSFTVLYCKLQYCTVLYCAVKYSTVLYCTVLNPLLALAAIFSEPPHLGQSCIVLEPPI